MMHKKQIKNRFVLFLQKFMLAALKALILSKSRKCWCTSKEYYHFWSRDVTFDAENERGVNMKRHLYVLR